LIGGYNNESKAQNKKARSNPHRYAHSPHPYPRKKAAHLVVKILKALNLSLFRKPKPLPGGQPWS